MKIPFVFLFLLMICYGTILAAQELPLASFTDLQTYSDKEVGIRGFFYRADKDEWILAAEPNLKTCCIGTSQQYSKQIHVEGDFSAEPSLSKAVLLQGILSFQDHRWHLRNAHFAEAEEKKESNLHWIGLTVFLGVAGIFFFRKYLL